MAFPLIPFAAGIAVGSLATYGATDKALHKRIAQITDKAVGQVKAGADKIAEWVPAFGRSTKEKAVAAVEAVEQGAESVSDKAKAVVDEAVKKAKRSAKKAEEAVDDITEGKSDA
jgi:DNA-binding ferritin-like protein